MKFELTDSQMQTITQLCIRHSVGRLAIFGSAVTGGFRETDSDFDFTVVFESQTGLRPADQYFELKAALEDLLGRTVDLVVDGAVRNRFFREELDATAVVLYAA